MDARTLEALKGSIEKWEEIVAGKGDDNGAINCSLCAVFYNHDCVGCPVRVASGLPDCRGTPWHLWYQHQRMHHGRDRFPLYIHEGCDYCARLVRAELEFLKSLLPTEASDAS